MSSAGNSDTPAPESRPAESKAPGPAGVSLEKRLGGQLDALQSMLSSLAAKVEAIEEEASAGPHGAARTQQQRQGAVADAYRDMAQAEHAVGLLEPRLDQLLSRLDSLLEETEH